jgi:hypothetical protein
MTDSPPNSDAEMATQHLADLLGTAVAGFLPSQADRLLKEIDLEVELFRRRNVGLASLALLAALVKSKGPDRERLIRYLRLEHFTKKSIEQFLFSCIVNATTNQQEITAEVLTSFVQEFEPTVWGEPPTERSLRGYYFKVAQILAIDPSDAQIEQAVALRQDWATRRGYVDK